MKALLFDFSRVLLFPKDDHFELNTELLDYLHTLKDQFQLYIFTSGSMIKGLPSLQAQLIDFQKIYFGAELGLAKSDPAAYTWVALDIGLPPEEILFIDDSEHNIAAAQTAGLQTLHYKSNEALMRKIGSVI